MKRERLQDNTDFKTTGQSRYFSHVCFGSFRITNPMKKKSHRLIRSLSIGYTKFTMDYMSAEGIEVDEK